MTVAPSSAARWIAAATLFGALLAVLGPFGTYLNHGMIARFGYWVAAMLIGLLLYGAALLTARRVAPPGARLRWPVLICAALIATMTEALITRMAASWLWPEIARSGLSLPLWFAQTATIGMIATLGAVFALRRGSASVPDDDKPSAVTPAPAKSLSGDVLALQMEDHYVRVHTPRGSELILMPLSLAIEGTSKEGLKTHRSWWVARHAVSTVEGTSRAMRLHLTNGVVAPVARTAVVRLKAAGWIAT